MQDIRCYSDEELSLIVFNDNYWYNIRYLPNLIEVLKEEYTFNEEQEEVLINDLEEEMKND